MAAAIAGANFMVNEVLICLGVESEGGFWEFLNWSGTCAEESSWEGRKMYLKGKN
jgi:hypothetical protein